MFSFCFAQMAFSAVMYLWNKKPLKSCGARMSESILNILCHIINSEALIKVRSCFQDIYFILLFLTSQEKYTHQNRADDGEMDVLGVTLRNRITFGELHRRSGMANS